LGCGQGFTSGDPATGGGSSGGTGGTGSGTGGATSGGGGTGGSGTAGGGGGSVELCPGVNSIDNLIDDFDGTELSALWEPVGAVDPGMMVSNGMLHLNPSAGEVGIRSVATYDLTACRIVLDIDLLPDHANYPLEAYFDLQSGGDDLMSIYVWEGTVRAWIVEGGVHTVDQGVAFDPSKNRFWRVVEQNGQTALQVAGSDLNYESLTVVNTPPYAHAIRVEIGTVAYEAISGAGIFRIDDVNVGP
jgi:hypothetical protein